MSPETITIAVRNGFKPEQMLKDTENMLKEQGEKNIDEIMEIVFDSWKSIVDKSETPWALCEDCYESIQIYIRKARKLKKELRYEPVSDNFPE